MKRGDIVHLKRPFIPMIGSTQAFFWGQIVGLVTDLPQNNPEAEVNPAEVIELLIHLYDPATGLYFRDDWNEVAVFSLYIHEVEPG